MVKSLYTFETAQNTAEKERLDELHISIRNYQNSQVAFAPQIYEPSPRKILDLGCGSGAWAFDVASQYPEAEVVVADASPTLQDAILLNNMRFQLVDVTQPLAFDPMSFDVVHARLLFTHVPDAVDAVKRAAELVKPGGWLFLEDLDVSSAIESGGPIVSKLLTLWTDILAMDGVDTGFGRKIESAIRSTSMFSAIHTQTVPVPVCDSMGVAPELAQLGVTVRSTMKQVAAYWCARFAEEGITKELTEKYAAELDSEVFQCLFDVYFVWAQRMQSVLAVE
ncbi:S-adenosyl-L-methionine-dependent methyltransferase [Favolaschia claudopus]|uniref:S-adenosyl-L-methionine-dependent methyltransferase n=1 Tax=Favolaschia claudopus TaxID=2862362 RepID=A0AAW0ABN1_9AGAR